MSNIGVAAVSFGGNTGDSTATLTGNNIHGVGVGVQVIDDNLGDSFIPDVSGSSNQLAGNFYGVDNQTAKNLLFKQNWWGNATGPSDWSIGTGTGVSENVQFFPWSTNAASTTFQACTVTGDNSPEHAQRHGRERHHLRQGRQRHAQRPGRQRPAHRRRW